MPMKRLVVTDTPQNLSVAFGHVAGCYYEFQNIDDNEVRAYEGVNAPVSADELDSASRIQARGWQGVDLAAGESVWVYTDQTGTTSKVVGWGP